MTKKRFFQPQELSAIRESCDWRRLLDDLGVRADVKKCTQGEFWGYSPFSPAEKTASFHMTDPGIWYCWSSHACAPGRDTPGGGVIELVQAVFATRGQILKLNEAAGWIVERGYSDISHVPEKPAMKEKEKPEENTPITTDLFPKLTALGSHPAFVQRGIGAATCTYLRCGFLEGTRAMLRNRIVFQIGGLAADGQTRTILSHMGRALDEEQEVTGKWLFYKGFNPSLELYNIDNLAQDEEAQRQLHETGHVVLMEGGFDIAKCVEAGIKNVAATFGARLYAPQIAKLKALGVKRALLFYDRDKAGFEGSAQAAELLSEHGVEAAVFDWSHTFTTTAGQAVPIPEDITDPCEFTVGQLRWLRAKGLV